MTTEIMTEIKTETTTKIRLTNKDPIVGLGDNAYGAAAAKHYVSTRWTKYLPYKYPLKDVPKNDVEKNWSFGLVLLKHETKTSLIN